MQTKLICWQVNFKTSFTNVFIKTGFGYLQK